jgi:hypothetical protein
MRCVQRHVQLAHVSSVFASLGPPRRAEAVCRSTRRGLRLVRRSGPPTRRGNRPSRLEYLEHQINVIKLYAGKSAAHRLRRSTLAGGSNFTPSFSSIAPHSIISRISSYISSFGDLSAGPPWTRRSNSIYSPGALWRPPIPDMHTLPGPPPGDARLRFDNCNDLHRPRVHNHDLVADHEVVISTPTRFDCDDRVRNRDKVD